MLKYKWLLPDGRSANGDEAVWTIGEWRSVERDLIMCKHGYHCSDTPYDALQFVTQPILALVEIPDDPAEYLKDLNKYCARRMRVLVKADATWQLQLWALDCYDHHLLAMHDFTPDPRSLAAVQAAREYLSGQISHDAYLTALQRADVAWHSAEAAQGAKAAWHSADAAWHSAKAAQSAKAAWQSADTAWHSAKAVGQSAEAAQQSEINWQRIRLSELVLPLVHRVEVA